MNQSEGVTSQWPPGGLLQYSQYTLTPRTTSDMTAQTDNKHRQKTEVLVAGILCHSRVRASGDSTPDSSMFQRYICRSVCLVCACVCLIGSSVPPRLAHCCEESTGEQQKSAGMQQIACMHASARASTQTPAPVPTVRAASSPELHVYTRRRSTSAHALAKSKICEMSAFDVKRTWSLFAGKLSAHKYRARVSYCSHCKQERELHFSHTFTPLFFFFFKSLYFNPEVKCVILMFPWKTHIHLVPTQHLKALNRHIFISGYIAARWKCSSGPCNALIQAPR